MSDDQETYSKMKPSGLPGLLVVIFVVSAFASLFTPQDFTYLALGIGGSALMLAFVLHVAFAHQTKKDAAISLLPREHDPQMSDVAKAEQPANKNFS